MDEELFGECDYCGMPYFLGGDDHNAETGNHYGCENLDTPTN